MLFLKLLLTAWVAIIIPIYWKNYGLQNFLWFSDIALFGTVFALWLESPFLMSTIMLYSLPVEILWNIDFFIYLVSGYHFVGTAYYMFEAKYSLFLRFLSLFHMILPVVWVLYLFKFGYDVRALPYAVILCWATLILTYLFTDPQANINGVFYPEVYRWKISPRRWLILLLIIFPVMYLLMHVVFLTIQKLVW